MSFVERLEEGARSCGNLLCLGLAPVPERIGHPGPEAMEEFLEELLQELLSQKVLPSPLKPNLAYFEQYGWAGLKVLESLLARWRRHCFIILDAKRGDIGRSSTAYARALFETWQGDAATVSPWMGRDSVQPFLEHAPKKGVYLLLRTSNPGHADLQKSLWQELARRLPEWGPVGAVVGATSVEDLRQALALTGNLPFLIPGVGTQGGDAAEVVAALCDSGSPHRHRVNVTSAILFPNGRRDLKASVGAAGHYVEALSLPTQ